MDQRVHLSGPGIPDFFQKNWVCKFLNGMIVMREVMHLRNFSSRRSERNKICSALTIVRTEQILFRSDRLPENNTTKGIQNCEFSTMELFWRQDIQKNNGKSYGNLRISIQIVMFALPKNKE